VNLQFVKDQMNVLKLQVQSRHISRKMYRCFVKYKPNSGGISGLLQYACDCVPTEEELLDAVHILLQ